MLNSLYGNLLQKIQTLIATELPAIRYCDIDMGQLEHYTDRPNVSFPCLLIDFTGTTYTQEGELVEEGDANIMFKLGFAPFSSSNNLAPESVQEMALNYFELENQLYVLLKAWNADGMIQPMNRVKDGTQQRNDTYRVRISVFSTMFMDDSASPQFTHAKPPLKLEFED